EVDAVVFVGRHPALPERLGRVAEHGAAVELLAVAEQGGQGSHGGIRGIKRRGPQAAQITLKGSELLGVVAEQRGAAAADAGLEAEAARQQAAEEELGAGQLAGMEGF